jgi:outer membrane protein
MALKPFLPLCACLALAVTVQLSAQDPPSVTLAEAVALAAQKDPAVVEAQGNVRSTGVGVRSAKGQYLPSLSGNASGGSSFSDGPARTDPITGELLPGGIKSQSVTAGLSSDLELFAGFRRGADVRSAQGREDVAEAAFRGALAQSALQTSADFFSALRGRELVTVRREGVRRAEEQLAIAVSKLVTRAATVADSLRAVVQLGEARLSLVSEEANLAAAEASLARRLGLPGRVAAVSDSTLVVPGPAPDAAAILLEAVENAPAVIQAEASVRAAEANVTAAKASYWPRLMLSGNYAFSGSDRNNYSMFNNRSINLGVSWPLFNRFQREQQVVERETARDAALARAADARRQVEASLAGQFAALDAARQRIELARLSVEAARADVRVALERYRLGSIGITDLNASQAGLTRAEENEVSARFEYLRAKAEIEAIVGRTL